MNIMRALKFLAIAAVFVILLAGCGQKADIVPSEAAATLLEQVTFRDTLVEAQGDVAKQYYQLDGNVSDFAIYISGSSATAEEIAVIKTSDLESGKKILEKRLDDLRFRFEDYVPAEIAKIDSPVIAAKQGVVVMVLADDVAQAQKAVDSLFK